MRIIISEPEVSYRPSCTVDTPEKAAEVCKEIAKSVTEVACALYLDIQCQLIASEIVSMGILGECMMHPREIFRPAIQRNAYSIVVVHNHPSGQLKPSRDDVNMANKLLKTGEIVGIKLMDFILVDADGNSYSLRSNHHFKDIDLESGLEERPEKKKEKG